MKFAFDHMNVNITNPDASVAFYQRALGLTVARERVADDGRFKLIFLTDEAGRFKLELTWLRDHEGAYQLGENETHLCFVTDDYAAAHEMHKQMGCICFENEAMGVYFIVDPDGYWIEIVPVR